MTTVNTPRHPATTDFTKRRMDVHSSTHTHRLAHGCDF